MFILNIEKGDYVTRNSYGNDTVFNMFLQILDDGRLTDNKGKTVDFKNKHHQ